MKSSSRPYCSPPSPESPAEVVGDRAACGRRASAGLVDAHAHVFPAEMVAHRESYLERDARFGALYRSPRAAMVTAEDLVESMDEHGVDVCVLVGFPFADQGLCRSVNDHLLDAVGRFPGRVAGLACVAPGAPGARAELERCLDLGLSGCGELAPERDEADAGRRRSDQGLTAVADCLRERGLPLLVHASEPLGHEYPGKGRFTPEACYALARAHPGLTIVFGHLGGGLFLYEAMPEVRSTLAHVFYDTAAVPYLYGPEIYEACVATAGPEKLIFGSDYPLLAPDRYAEGLARLDTAARAAVEGGNARRVFRL
jgi:predicted TIM-barrel fold metal-dependent hydrolase